MAKRKLTRKGTQPPTTEDGDRYFDATFTTKERLALQYKLMDVCGYGRGGNRGLNRRDYIGFDHEILLPARDEIWHVFKAHGLDYHRDHARLCDYTLIHICRELEIDYKSFAANMPKLSIAGFVECAKRSFPDFRQPRNKIEAKIQENKLNALWSEWRDEECVRTGCDCESHWLCSDRFIDQDYPEILKQVAAHNETRPRFAPLKLVHSRN